MNLIGKSARHPEQLRSISKPRQMWDSTHIETRTRNESDKEIYCSPRTANDHRQVAPHTELNSIVKSGKEMNLMKKSPAHLEQLGKIGKPRLARNSIAYRSQAKE